MHIIHARNVNDALPMGMCYLRDYGEQAQSRNGPVLVSPIPVTTIYDMPWQRVLLNQRRHANPYFHLFESLWMLEGRRDVSFLTQFIQTMAEFSDNGSTFHAPYGYRLRHAFGTDQLDAVVRILQKSAHDRRAVLQIWGAQFDLETLSKDIPCNDLVFLRVRDEALNITVCNRSNDAIWGTYGVNAVQFSILQEYLAARLCVRIGDYYQISNNFHLYTNNDYWKWFADHHVHGYPVDENPYNSTDVESTPLFLPETVHDVEFDIRGLFVYYDKHGNTSTFNWVDDIYNNTHFKSELFPTVVLPMLSSYAAYKRGANYESMRMPLRLMRRKCDWRIACEKWIDRVVEIRSDK
jgi:hypothetical protein